MEFMLCFLLSSSTHLDWHDLQNGYNGKQNPFVILHIFFSVWMWIVLFLYIIFLIFYALFIRLSHHLVAKIESLYIWKIIMYSLMLCGTILYLETSSLQMENKYMVYPFFKHNFLFIHYWTSMWIFLSSLVHYCLPSLTNPHHPIFKIVIKALFGNCSWCSWKWFFFLRIKNWFLI